MPKFREVSPKFKVMILRQQGTESQARPPLTTPLILLLCNFEYIFELKF
jgi:hypothetical protein